MHITEITQDGLFTLSTKPTSFPESSVYISGDSPSNAFTFGVLDDVGALFPMPDAVQNESFAMAHGPGVIIAVLVSGYLGTLTKIGVAE